MIRTKQEFNTYLQKTVNNNEIRNTYNCGSDSIRDSKYWNEFHSKCYKADKTLGIDFWSQVEYIYDHVE